MNFALRMESAWKKCTAGLSATSVVAILWVFSASCEAGGIHFENGKFFIINSVASGKSMTVSGPNYFKGSPIVTSPWIAQDSQTWLALGESTKKEGRSVGGPEKFVLVPQRQRWDWKEHIQKGEINVTIDTLPANTLVLTLDSAAVNLTQEVYNDESSQKWVMEDLSDGEILIKNWGNQQCIKNFDYKAPNFLEVLRKRIDNFFGLSRRRRPSPLGTLTCDREDITEKWLLEPAYVLNLGR